MNDVVKAVIDLTEKLSQKELVISEQRKRIDKLQADLNTAEINNCKLGFKVLATKNYGINGVSTTDLIAMLDRERTFGRPDILKETLTKTEVESAKLALANREQRAQILEMSKTIQAQAKEIADGDKLRRRYFYLRATVRHVLYLLDQAHNSTFFKHDNGPCSVSGKIEEASEILKDTFHLADGGQKVDLKQPEADQKAPSKKAGHTFYCTIFDDYFDQQP